MRTVETKVFLFNELNEYAKEVAIENFRNSREIFLDFFNDNAIEQIEELGFYGSVKLQYSLSNCQGDGLSFSCKGFDESFLLPIFAEILGKGKEKTVKAIMANCSFVNTGNSGHYCFASKSDIDYYFDSYKSDYLNISNMVTKVCEKLEDIYIELCKDLEKQGYVDIDYQYSDEAIIEDIEANEYEFEEDGTRF